MGYEAIQPRVGEFFYFVNGGRRTFDWASGRGLLFSGLEEDADRQGFEFETFEHLDLVDIEGKRNMALMGDGLELGQMTLTCFNGWYRTFPVSWAVPTPDLEGRTLFLASEAGKQWFIVMKPIVDRGAVVESGKGTSMSRARAGRLLQCILKVLMTELPHLGFNEINYKERLQNGVTSVDMGRLQRCLMEVWDEEIVEDGVDEFWNSHEPSFRCIMVGHNLAIRKCMR